MNSVNQINSEPQKYQTLELKSQTNVELEVKDMNATSFVQSEQNSQENNYSCLEQKVMQEYLIANHHLQRDEQIMGLLYKMLEKMIENNMQNLASDNEEKRSTSMQMVAMENEILMLRKKMSEIEDDLLEEKRKHKKDKKKIKKYRELVIQERYKNEKKSFVSVPAIGDRGMPYRIQRESIAEEDEDFYYDLDCDFREV